MRSPIKIFFALAGFVLLTATNAFAGKVELTTYYPAPTGEYRNLSSTENASFATSSGAVGIGTNTPASGTKLEVAGGPIKATGGLILPVLASTATAPSDNGSMWIQS